VVIWLKVWLQPPENGANRLGFSIEKGWPINGIWMASGIRKEKKRGNGISEADRFYPEVNMEVTNQSREYITL